MPAQQGKSELLQKYGPKLTATVNKLKDKPVDYTTGGFQDPPPGIFRGIARLSECGFAKYNPGTKNAGEFYFFARATIIEPKTVRVGNIDVPCENMTTSLQHNGLNQIPVCATKSNKGKVETMEEHVEIIRNEMLKLYPTLEVTDLEAAAAALEAAAPYLFFSTQKKEASEYLDPVTKKMKMGQEGVWQRWHGSLGLENYDPSKNGQAGVTDNTGSAPAPEEAATTDDLEMLASAGDSGETVAQDRLKTLAAEAGVDEKDVKGEDSWYGVKALIETAREAGGAAGETTEETAPEPEPEPVEEPFVPKVDDIYGFHPLDPKNKKPAKNPVEVKITAVDEKSQTCTVRRKDNKALIKGVAFTSLVDAPPEK